MEKSKCSSDQFYGNIVHDYQINNIGKHENNYLQRELMKSVSMKGLVDHRIEERARLQEEGAQKKVLDQYNVSSYESRG